MTEGAILYTHTHTHTHYIYIYIYIYDVLNDVENDHGHVVYSRTRQTGQLINFI